MPTYDYRCATCEAPFEVRRGLSEPESAVACPSGHETARRVFTPVAVGGATAPASGGVLRRRLLRVAG